MMARLRVLGAIDIESGPDEAQVRDLLAKPKLTALAVYLLLAHRHGWCRRDELAALFWPDSDQAHARSSLSQSLYQLRQHLGPESIATRGTEEVLLHPAALGCDAGELREAIAAGDGRAACRRYRGAFMPAFHLPDAPEFTHWADGVRESLRREVVGLAWKAASDAEASGDLSAAEACLTVAGELSLLDTIAVARAMAGLSRVHAAERALSLYRRHQSAMRSELEQDPDPSVIALADEIHRTGIEGVATLDASPVPVGPGEGGQPPPAARSRWRSPAAITTLTMLIVTFVTQLPTLPAHARLDAGRVAVLPAPDAHTDSISLRLAAVLPASLIPLLDGSAGPIAVPQPALARALMGRGLRWGEPVPPLDARRVAAAVGAEHYLTTHVVRAAGRVHLQGDLIETSTGAVQATVHVAIDSLDLIRAAERLAVELQVRWIGQESRLPQLVSQPAAAIREYAVGWNARREQRYLDAIHHFEKAMELDSTFALAALAYRQAAMWMPDRSPDRIDLDRANRILVGSRDQLSPGDQALADAMVATYRMESDGPSVLAVLRYATLRAPDREGAWLLLGDFILHDGMMLGIPNSIPLARQALDSALKLLPTLAEPARHLSEIHFAEGDTAFARRFLADHPLRADSFSHLSWTAASLIGDSASLRKLEQDLPRLHPDDWYWLIAWAQRAATGFPQADVAASLLDTMPKIDDLNAGEDAFALRHYRLNRGRPRAGLATIAGSRFPETRLFALSALQGALGLPAGWVHVDSIARLASVPLVKLEPGAAVWGACHLGVWRAMRGRGGEADSLAALLGRWADAPGERERAAVKVCPIMIRALRDSSPGLDGMRTADSVLLSEPAATLRTDLTRWNLLLARSYADRGHPELGLPMTTRLGFMVEGSAYQTAALMLEGELSLATGDSVRAARAYARAAKFLSDPEPGVRASADSVRALADALARSACGGDCGAYRW